MIRYSYNKEREGVVFAGAKDINASFKDLCAVCDSVRGLQVNAALELLDKAENGKVAILYRRHNRYMGDRHELGGKKGRWPKKCSGFVRKVLVNAVANARNKGEDPDSMQVVHVSANKTTVIARRPPKGIRFVRTGGYGYSPGRRSDIELAKIEVGIAYPKGKQRAQKKELPSKKQQPAPKDEGSKAALQPAKAPAVQHAPKVAAVREKEAAKGELGK